MKQTIKLKESELKRMIAESVKRALKEKKEKEFLDADSWIYSSSDADFAESGRIMNQHGKLPKGYDKNLTADDYPSVDALAGLNKHYEAEILPFVKDKQNNASWDAFDNERDSLYGDYGRYIDNDPYNSIANSDGSYFSDEGVGLRDYNFDPENYLSWDEQFSDAERERDSQNKEKSKTDKGIQAADNRPLHRKGSLNRELKESRINMAVNEVIRRILKR